MASNECYLESEHKLIYALVNNGCIIVYKDSEKGLHIFFNTDDLLSNIQKNANIKFQVSPGQKVHLLYFDKHGFPVAYPAL